MCPTDTFGIAVLEKMRNVEANYADKRDRAENEDQYWIGGILYYNKNDKHSMVNVRTGFGTTMNLATPIGMGFAVFGALVFLTIPVMCLWMVLEEYTPIKLSLINETLTAEHLSVDYEIPVENIENITVINELPTWSKVSGTGMDNLCKGTFYIRNEGKCEAFVNPENTEFIKIEADGVRYYMSGADDDATARLIEELQELTEVQMEVTEE